MHPKIVKQREYIRNQLLKWKERNEEVQMETHMRDLIHKQRNPDEVMKKFVDNNLAEIATDRREKWLAQQKIQPNLDEADFIAGDISSSKQILSPYIEKIMAGIYRSSNVTNHNFRLPIGVLVTSSD